MDAAWKRRTYLEAILPAYRMLRVYSFLVWWLGAPVWKHCCFWFLSLAAVYACYVTSWLLKR